MGKKKHNSILFQFFHNFQGLKYRGFTGFREAENRSHFLIKYFTMFMMLFFTFGTWLVILGMSFWSLYNGNYDSSNWFLPYKIILLDRSSIFGWYCEFILQMLSGYWFVLTIASTVTFFGGCSYYIDACLKQFKHMFMEIDRSVENGERIDVIENDVFETVIFHNKIFDIFDVVADIYSAAIFFHLIFNILFFAGSIYQTEMVRKISNDLFVLFFSFNFYLILFKSPSITGWILTEQTFGNVGLGFLFTVLCVMEGLSYTFILCYFANASTFSMAELANVVYESSWYYQPPKIQKLLVLIIARGQKPNIFMGFKMIYCSLESFTKVCDGFFVTFCSSEEDFKKNINEFYFSSTGPQLRITSCFGIFPSVKHSNVTKSFGNGFE